VEVVGAGLERSVDDSAAVAAELGAEVVVLHLEFLQRVDGGGDGLAGKRLQVEDVGVVVHTVEEEVVVEGAGAVGGEVGVAAGDAAGGSGACGEDGKLLIIATVQGQL
jgi:hypothetical protein